MVTLIEEKPGQMALTQVQTHSPDRRAEAEAMFFDMSLKPNQRSLAAIAKTLDIPHGTIKNWSYKHRWMDRRQANVERTQLATQSRFAELATRGVDIIDRSLKAGERIVKRLNDDLETDQPTMTHQEHVESLEKTSRALKPLVDCLERLTAEDVRKRIAIEHAKPQAGPTIHAHNVAVLSNENGAPSFWGAKRIGESPDKGSELSGEGSEWTPEADDA